MNMDGVTIENLLYGICAAGIGFSLVWLFLDRREDKKDADPTAPNGKPWWQVLELSPTASRDQARTAYWKKMQEFEPGKLAQLGPELRPLAELRAQEIKAAFEQSERRFNVVANPRPSTVS
jgi:DnaJ-domain-containing protein 1